MTPPQIKPKGRASDPFSSDSWTGSIPDAHDFGDTSVKNGSYLRILDTGNENGVYDQGKDEVLKVNVKNGVETTTRLDLDSKKGKAALKDFKKQYGIDLHKSQFNFFMTPFVQTGFRNSISEKYQHELESLAKEPDEEILFQGIRECAKRLNGEGLKEPADQISARLKEFDKKGSKIADDFLKAQILDAQVTMLQFGAGRAIAEGIKDEAINRLLEKRQKEGLTYEEVIALTSWLTMEMADLIEAENSKGIEDLKKLLLEIADDLKSGRVKR